MVISWKICGFFFTKSPGYFVKNLMFCLQNSKNLVISCKSDFYDIPRIWWFRENLVIIFTKSQESGDFVKNLVNFYEIQENGDFLQNSKNLVIAWKIWLFFTKSLESGEFVKNLVIFYEIARIWWFLTKSQKSGGFVKNLAIAKLDRQH